MPDLTSFTAKICLTSAAVLIHQHKILLIHHKKLNLWLPPGGHVEENELPHQTAERECLEESGVAVKAYSPQTDLYGTDSQYLPTPFLTNLHWISKDNFEVRLAGRHPDKRIISPKWPRGCEQHLTFCFLVHPIGSLKITQNVEETTGIGWFTLAAVMALGTTTDIKQEIALAFRLSGSPK